MQVLIRGSLDLHLSRGGRLAVQGDLGRGGGEMVVGAVGHIIVGAIVTVLVVGKAEALIEEDCLQVNWLSKMELEGRFRNYCRIFFKLAKRRKL